MNNKSDPIADDRILFLALLRDPAPGARGRPEAVFGPASGEDRGAVHVEAELVEAKLGAEKMVETGDFCGISGFAHFN